MSLGLRGAHGALTLVVVAIVAVAAGCSVAPAEPVPGDATDCAGLLDKARSYVASGRTGDGRLDWTLDEMALRCEREYQIFVDEVSAAPALGAQEEIAGSNSAEPAGATSWEQAVDLVGTSAYVCGPLASARNFENDVFFNVGLDYPSPGRFTIVVWDVGPMGPVAPGTTVCAEGFITEYQGVAQIELQSVSGVEIWE